MDKSKDRLKKLLGLAVEAEADPFEGIPMEEEDDFSFDVPEEVDLTGKRKARIMALLTPKFAKNKAV